MPRWTVGDNARFPLAELHSRGCIPPGFGYSAAVFMAWRIHDCVKRGEIDNRERGVVTGRIWLDGLEEPLRLELQGNACADLAGCLLTFENPGETFPLPRDRQLVPLQQGSIGDLTASRKVRVPDVPVAEFYRLRKAGLPAPEHMANCLYLEWFSEANGRVVIESADYRLTISPPAWRLSPEDEQRRQQAAAEGFGQFLRRLSQAIEAAKPKTPPEEDWDEWDYEQLLRESDARTDKYGELLDRYQDDPNRDAIVAREMGWTWLEGEVGQEEGPSNAAEAVGTHETSEEPGQDADGAEDDDPFDIDEINRLCEEAVENPPEPDPATEGIDWVRRQDGHLSHPLSLRAFESSVALWHRCKELGLDKSSDADLGDLLTEFQITCAKLAGALNTLAYGRAGTPGAFTVAYLKRGLGHLHAAQAALEKVAGKHLLPAEVITRTRTELFALRTEILRLMEEFRGRD